jgi:hypothetical protein
VSEGRVWVAPGALPLLLALAAYPVLLGAPTLAPLVLLGLVAVALYAAGLAGIWPGGLMAGVGVLAVEYMAGLYLRGAGLDVTAPLFGAALFLCAELGWLGLESRRGGGPWPARWLGIAALTLLGAAAGWLVVLAALLPLAGGPALTALGVAAAVVVALGLVWLARSAWY